MTSPTRLLYFPPDDHELKALTEALLHRYADDAVDPDGLARTVMTELQHRFPKARVRRRDPTTQQDPDQTIWYVYRDGSAIAGLRPTAEELRRSAEAER
jgi:hypothetical protein